MTTILISNNMYIKNWKILEGSIKTKCYSL